MARQINKLSALNVSRFKTKGIYSDGGGLCLRITASGGKFWVFRFMLNGQAREMGLGALHAISLSDARLKATECRRLLAEGKDPISSRDAVKAQAKLSAAKEKTFKECAEAYIESHKASWRNAKHAQQWTRTLETYAYPVLGNLHVQDIDVALVIKVLEPIWLKKAETASRLRGRIEVVLDWAGAREYRTGDNPARWRGHMENLLPKRSKIKRTKHHPALPYEQIGAFMKALKDREGMAAKALAFTILTGGRTNEALKATWDEMDLDNRIWNLPAVRTKADRDHRVALSCDAVRLLQDVRQEQKDASVPNAKYIFCGPSNKHLSNMAMLTVIRRMNGEGTAPKWIDPRQDGKPIVTHGFRSTFRDWAAEQTNFPREIAESALAHISGDSVELSYRRTDFFEKRRQMMEAWAQYCATPLNLKKQCA